MKSIRFDGRVAIVTGAGGGLGRAYALLLASRGAAVVVNDLRAADSEAPGAAGAAQAVVDEIQSAGGRALANTSDIAMPEGAQRLVDDAVAAFGRVDILINNAGILRDKSLARMDIAEFEEVVRVHLLGSAWCTRAAWPIMQRQQYGRIIMTTSAAGLYGNYGQSNYGAAKLAVVGLMNTLKHEGARAGIHVNAIAPVALTRMTEGVALGRLLDDAAPECVAAGVAFLVSEACGLTGQILSAGGGYFSTVRIVEGVGVRAPVDDVSPEFVASHWPDIADPAAARHHQSAFEALQDIFTPSEA